MSYGREKIKLAADINPTDYKIKIEGWAKRTDINVFGPIGFFFEEGLEYADIFRDGVVAGPNLALYRKILEKCPDSGLIASEGVRNAMTFKN